MLSTVRIMPKSGETTGEWTVEALIRKARERTEQMLQLKAAVEFARAHGYGAKKAVKHVDYPSPLVTIGSLHHALGGRLKGFN